MYCIQFSVQLQLHCCETAVNGPSRLFPILQTDDFNTAEVFGYLELRLFLVKQQNMDEIRPLHIDTGFSRWVKADVAGDIDDSIPQEALWKIVGVYSYTHRLVIALALQRLSKTVSTLGVEPADLMLTVVDDL